MAFVIDTLASRLKHPWSLSFLPHGAILLSEKHGGLWLVRDSGAEPRPVSGVPASYQEVDEGLLDVALDPAFATNRLIYLAYSEGNKATNRLALFRARLEDDRLVDGRTIFRATDKGGPGHPGGRIVFLADSTLLLTIGEGYEYRDQAQNLKSTLGKVVRLNREGVPPLDNPFYGQDSVRPEIYSFGHRNPQGLLVDRRDGTIWSHEHGPRGGDEINRLVGGANYGWPLATHGIDYDGELISKNQTAEGIVSPVVVWVPSIAPSGFSLYLGTAFPQWTGDFFVGALAERSLRRVRMRAGEVVLQEVLLRDLKWRIRDVRSGPDGLLYILTDAPDGVLVRLRPPR